MQHKRELGDKYVSGVRIVKAEPRTQGNPDYANLVFYIEDVPPPAESHSAMRLRANPY